jgi:hypothetical protein
MTRLEVASGRLGGDDVFVVRNPSGHGSDVTLPRFRRFADVDSTIAGPLLELLKELERAKADGLPPAEWEKMASARLDAATMRRAMDLYVPIRGRVCLTGRGLNVLVEARRRAAPAERPTGVRRRIDVTLHAVAARQPIDAYHERERIAQEISALASTAGRVHPGDVSFTRAEQVVREATRLLDGGGERPPTLTRDPRQPRQGASAGERVAAA